MGVGWWVRGGICKRRNGTYIWTNDGGDDGRRHDDATDSQPGQHEYTPQLVEIVDIRNSDGAAAGSHTNTTDDQQFPVVSAEDAE